MTKACLHQEWDMSIDAAIEAEAQAQAICMQTKDYGRAYRAFVADFLGADRGLKRLSLIAASEVASSAVPEPEAPAIPADASVQTALAAILAAGSDAATLVDADGTVRGSVTLAAIRNLAAAPGETGGPAN